MTGRADRVETATTYLDHARSSAGLCAQVLNERTDVYRRARWHRWHPLQSRLLGRTRRGRWYPFTFALGDRCVRYLLCVQVGNHSATMYSSRGRGHLTLSHLRSRLIHALSTCRTTYL